MHENSLKSTGSDSTTTGRPFLRADECCTPDVPEVPRAVAVTYADGCFVIALEDGRALHVPLEWSVRLRDATPEQLENVELVGGGVDISWPDLDEDMHVVDLLYPSRFADQVKGVV